MASVHIRKRKAGDGERFVVRYRIGGRSTPVTHAGSFKTLAEAEARVEFVRKQIAAGSSTVRLTAIPQGVAHEWVYFIRQGIGGPIKIGRAKNPERRRRHLQSANPYPLHLLAIMPLFSDEEERLHEAFAHHRLMGEWFKPVPELLAYIREVSGEQELA